MLFRESRLGAVHLEQRRFDDFAKQPLLPNKLSHFGPGLAWADVDADGDDDFFLAGAAGSAGRLYSNEGSDKGSERQFVIKTVDPFEADRAFEDVGVLFLEADGDGDPDLYVVSGGVEGTGGTEDYRDRLYLNDGRGSFRPAPVGVLPPENDSGSCVCAADFDRDGDLDLFVGGRVTPGKYPLSPPSRFLRNDGSADGARFSDMTAEWADGVSPLERVTSAVWSDVDNDGWPDLLAGTEWGPVRVLTNTPTGRNGSSRKLRELSTEAGTAALTGWWNGLTAADLDHDGRIDYVAANFGSNTKYHPEPGHPVAIYYGEFDDSGVAQVVEAKTTADGALLPVRGKSCSQNAMPFLQSKFPKFHDFASATLEKIYSPEKLAGARRFEAVTLESGIFWNDTPAGGPVRLAFQSLPRFAQVAPVFGAVATDANSDGHADLVLAQNFYHPQRETGRMAGGVGAVLLGDGKRGFTGVWPSESGFGLAADARGLTTANLNGDGRAEVIAAVNDGPARVFSAMSKGPAQTLAIRLAGPPGNPTAVGARGTLKSASGAVAAFESGAGSGWLSQSAATIFLTAVRGAEPAVLDVRWPDGQTIERRIEANQTTVEVAMSKAAVKQPAARPNQRSR